MTAYSKLLISSAAVCLAVAANAGTAMNAPEARITNGGTGFIGVMQSADQPRNTNARVWMLSAESISRIPSSAGEASTMVNGRPNQDPDAPATGSMAASSATAQSWGMPPRQALTTPG